ncbi:MAG: hypothetical protein KAU62_00395 [Candidatus Heimdallarchaeota archaeon]|nr:hypothetical protein [Candidatus Heimdallarchaeota archaeon]MCG3254505.1 hypothetical protein [Candidatus Heimdallarchaeota archaeon]MCK4609590.1 hypothetical protein [Candidatus Heimdallarchaeota archaeon]
MKKIKILFLINFLVLIVGFFPSSLNVNSTSDSIILNNDISLDDLSSWWWTPVELISESSTVSAYHPDIACDSENNIHIIFDDVTPDLGGSGADRDVFYVQYDAQTKTWLPLEVVSTESTSGSAYARIAIDSENNLHVTWSDYTDILGAGTDEDVFYKQRSSSGSWSTTELVSSDSTLEIDRPVIHVDVKDTTHIVWSDDSDGWDVLYKRRTSAGSWSSTFIVSEYSTLIAYTPRIDSDSTGNIYFTWADETDYAGSGVDLDIFFRTLDADLTTWSPYTIISTESDDVSGIPNISVDDLDRIHISWIDKSDYDSAGTDWDVFYKYYDSQFDTWHISKVVSTESDSPSTELRMVSDNSHLYLVWEDRTEYSGVGPDADIFFKYKDLTTDSWSSLGVLTSGHIADSITPALAIDNLGHLHVTWSDWTDILGAGAGPDIMYRKFVGSPGTPTLNNIVPNPAKLGNISLSWTEKSDAVSYQIYRDISYISTVSGLTPIATVSSISYIDDISAAGTYFYTVLASNDYGQSSLSNIESIQVLEDEISPGFFKSLRIGEILVLAAIIGGVQLLITTIVVVFVKTGPKIRSPKTGKK